MRYEVYDTTTGQVVQRSKTTLRAHQGAINWTNAQRVITGHKFAYRALGEVREYKRRSYKRYRE